MGTGRVKHKFRLSVVLAALAGLTFCLSWAGAFPKNWVESYYSRTVFPTVSHIVGSVADAVPFSWFDVAVVFLLGMAVYSLRWSNIWALLGVASAAYLWFFWLWGLNYHRVALETKLGLDSTATNPEQVEMFVRTAASELNRLWPIVAQTPFDGQGAAHLAGDRVRLVVSKIDGTNWAAANRIKHSIVAAGWFRVAGIDGMFNPFGHEPVVASSLLSFELPFVMTHELAHVRGIPNEGDANLVATLATLASDDPAFRYSGWFHLWLYLQNAKRDALLDAGPRRDLQIFSERVRSQEIPWVSNLQSAVLDWHLKANRVHEGVASYSKFVTLAIATQDRWQEFR